MRRARFRSATGRTSTANSRSSSTCTRPLIPKGINANNLKVYHEGVQITTICGDSPVADCYSVKKLKTGFQITIWLEHNGKLNIG